MAKYENTRLKEMQLLIELGLWPKDLAQPNPTSLERLHRLDVDIQNRYRELYLPKKSPNAYLRKGLKDYQAAVIQQRKDRKSKTKKKKELNDKHWNKLRTQFLFHLGSGISSWLNDFSNNREVIANHNLPVFENAKELASFFGLKMNTLAWYCYHRKIANINHYISFELEKKTGGIRKISKPKSNLATIQQTVKNEILDKLNWRDNIFGFIKGKSAIRNASYHLGAKIIINIDIKEFFPSVTFKQVRKAFANLGYSGQIATILALLTTMQPSEKFEYKNKTYHIYDEQRYLPQGACTSPSVSNLVATKFDQQLLQRAERMGYRYSRYADDMTFSAKEPKNVKAMLYMINKTLELHGFKTNSKKTRILFPQNSQKITGFTINSRTPKIPRIWRKNLRAAVHQFTLLNEKEKAVYNIVSLIGSINYLNLSHPKLAEKYLKIVMGN